MAYSPWPFLVCGTARRLYSAKGLLELIASREKGAPLMPVDHYTSLLIISISTVGRTDHIVVRRKPHHYDR